MRQVECCWFKLPFFSPNMFIFNVWSQEEKGTTEGEMVGWHQRFDWHEFEQVPGVGDGQERLECCKELDTSEWLNWLTEPIVKEH